MQSILQDIRYGLRQLRKSPSFTLTAILTLAFGIGATTTLFSVVDGVLLKPLAYRDSGRLVVIWEKVRFLEKLFPYTGANPRHFDNWRRSSTTFEDLTILQQGSTGVGITNDHPRLVGRILSLPNLLDILGVQPTLGRNFLPVEATPGHEKVAILSWHLWQTLYNGDPTVIGRTIQIADAPYQVVGILPKNFYFPKANELAPVPLARQLPDNEILTPLAIDFNDFGLNSDYGNYVPLARLKPGVTITQAQENLDALDDTLARQIPPGQLDGPAHGAFSTYIQPMKEVIVGKTSTRLWLLMAAVLSVLLIACINLANAQLARLVTRDREAAVRSALGASASRLLQSALAEILILSLTGGALGIALAFFAVHRLAAYTQLAIPRTQTISVNLTVLTVSITLTMGAALIFGLLPALRLLHINPQQALQYARGSSGSRRSALLRRWLVGAQVFACTTLLLVAGLLAKSLIHLTTFNKGFSPDHVIAADVFLQGNTFKEDKVRTAFDDGVLDKLRALPGVQSGSLVSSMLLEGERWIDGITPVDTPSNNSALANYRWISPAYFDTLRQPILEGRALDDRDRNASNAIISQTAAKAVWPDRSALGRQFLFHGKPFTVVGIVGDAHSNSLRDAPVNMVYLHFNNKPPYATYFFVRTKQDPQFITEELRNAIWSYNPNVTIARIHTLDAQISDSLAPEHLQTGIFVAFGAAALLLALLGIYGTLAYSVEARTQEVGIRMALGATRQSVYTLMLATIALPVTTGLVLGCLTSFTIGKSLASLLYNTRPTDLTVILPVVALFAIAAAAATFIPCRRAAKIEPMQALRTE
ncbi:MAG TPA: ABC transporter permease [Edaphobacter sp.]|jgi:predicted permease|nr:ABC transporter permease [Edaphobacter sp.]